MMGNGLAAGQPAPAAPAAKHDDWKWWRDNSTAIVGLLSVAIVAIRLLGVGRGDPEIAYAILQIGGTGTVLIATLVSTLGLIAIPACGIAAYFFVRAIKKSACSTRIFQLGCGSFIMLYIAAYMAPAEFLVISVGAAVLVVVIWRTVRALHTSHRAAQLLPVMLIAGYVLAVLLYQLASPTPWLPVQAITVARQKPFTGYVLSQDNGKTDILTSNPEGVVSIPSQEIQATEQCTPHNYDWDQATALGLLERVTRQIITYPACPTTLYTQSTLARDSHPSRTYP
jgi:hypothetical protein